MKEKVFVFVVILCLCFVAFPAVGAAEEGAQEGVAWETMSLDDAVAKAIDQNKLIMIDFFSPT